GETMSGERGESGGGELKSLVDSLIRGNSQNVHAEAVAATERYVLTRVLEHTQGNISHAAKILGITRGSVRNKMRALNLTCERMFRMESGESASDLEEMNAVE